MNYQKIKSFIIEFDKLTKAKKGIVWIKDNKRETLREGYSYILGYCDSAAPNNFRCGEFVTVEFNLGIVKIINDSYGTYPVYVLDNLNKVLISNSIKILNQFNKSSLTINPEKIYSYFSLGYNIIGNTLYKDVKYLKPNSNILIKKEVKTNYEIIKRFNKNADKDTDESKILNLFKKAIKDKIKLIKDGKPVFGLTGGYDSLLGALLLKSMGISVPTVTIGNKNSQDVLIAKKRSKQIAINDQHIQILTEQLKINKQDLINVSEISGGMTTFGSVYMYKMKKILKEDFGYNHFLDCSHFEILRKKINSKTVFINRYNTPKSVVNKYFKNINDYELSIKDNLRQLKSEYGHRYIEKFYHYDRNAQGQHWKSLIANDLAGTRMTLIHDIKLLTELLNLKSNCYSKIIKLLSNKVNFNYDKEEKNLASSAKDLPFNNFSIIYNQKEYFLEFLNSEFARHLSTYFDIDKIKLSIKQESLDYLEDWFVLRLGSLLSFCNNNNIKLG